MGGYFSAYHRYQEQKYTNPKYVLHLGVYVIIFLTIVALIWALVVPDTAIAEMNNSNLSCDLTPNDARCKQSYLGTKLTYALTFVIVGSILMIGGMWLTAMSGHAAFVHCVKTTCRGKSGVEMQNCRANCRDKAAYRTQQRQQQAAMMSKLDQIQMQTSGSRF